MSKNEHNPENRPDKVPKDRSSFFSSTRERRLWLFTAAVVAGIYLTLGLASTLAQKFYNQDVAAFVFLSLMFLVALTVLLVALNVRPSGAEIGIGLGIVTVYLWVLLRMTIPERSHLIEYSIVAAFIYAALVERRNQGRSVLFPEVFAILATTLVGTADEFIQLFLPSRVFDPTDILFNFLAATMAVTASAILIYSRRAFSKR